MNAIIVKIALCNTIHTNLYGYFIVKFSYLAILVAKPMKKENVLIYIFMLLLHVFGVKIDKEKNLKIIKTNYYLW